MMLTRRNFKAGRPLKTFPLEEMNGILGYKLGYCDSCNEPILLCQKDAQEILSFLFRSYKEYKKLIEKLQPKQTYRRRLIKWLIGNLGEYPINQPTEPVYN